MIDESLSESEEHIFDINDKVAHIELESAPPLDPNETPTKRQVRFIDKAKRISFNLELLEAYIKDTSSPIQNTEQKSAPADIKVEFIYNPPAWSTPPKTKKFCFDVTNENVLLQKIPIHSKGHYLIGRLPLCDIVVDDVTCSRQHAVIQFRPGDPDPQTGKRDDEIYIYDLGSTSGTYVNGMVLQSSAYYPVFVNDIIQFGQCVNSYVIQLQKEPEVIVAQPKIIQPTTTPIISQTPNVQNSNAQHQISSIEKINQQLHTQTPNPKSDPSNQFRRPAPVRKKASTVSAGIFQDMDEYSDELGVVTSRPKNGSRPNIDTTPKLENPPPPRQDEDPALASVNSLLKNLKSVEQHQSSPNFSNIPKVESKQEESEEIPVVDNNIQSSQSLDDVKPPPAKSVQPVDPRSAAFNESDYKKQMMEAYERQQAENAEIRRKMKEREAQGLPPIIELPHVPERPRRHTVAASAPVKKKKKWWKRGGN